VVRRPERPLGHETGTVVEPADAVDARDLERLARPHGRKEPRQPPGQHRLAGPGRPDEQQAVPAGGGDLEPPAGERLSADVGEIRTDRRRAGRARAVDRVLRPPVVAPGAGQGLDPLPQGEHPAHRDPRDEGRLPGLPAWEHHRLEPGGPGALGDHERPAAGPDDPAEGELADDGDAVELHPRGLTARGQEPDRDREVESRSPLRQARGRQVDRDPPLRQLEPLVAERGPHALPRLADGEVAQPDDRERGQPGAHVDLHDHGARLQAVDRERLHAGQHGRHARPGSRAGTTVGPCRNRAVPAPDLRARSLRRACAGTARARRTSGAVGAWRRHGSET
jgi:hypothetical protein